MIFLPLKNVLDQRGKHLFPLAHHDVIHPGKRPEMFQAHLPVKVGPAKHNADGRIQLFDQFRQGEAGDVLIKGRGKSHDFVLIPVVGSRQLGEKLRRHGMGHVFKESRGTSGLPSRALKHGLEHLGVLRVFRIVVEEERREKPFSDHPALLAQHVIERHAEAMRKKKIEMITLGPDGVVFQHARQRA